MYAYLNVELLVSRIRFIDEVYCMFLCKMMNKVLDSLNDTNSTIADQLILIMGHRLR